MVDWYNKNMRVSLKRILILLIILLPLGFIARFFWENPDHTKRGLTLEEDSALFTPYLVSVYGPGELQVAPGTTTVYKFTVINLGRNSDVYTISASSSLSWADLSRVPGTVSLAPEASQEISIRVTVPKSAKKGMIDEIRLGVTSQTNPRLEDVAYTRTHVREKFLWW